MLSYKTFTVGFTSENYHLFAIYIPQKKKKNLLQFTNKKKLQKGKKRYSFNQLLNLTFYYQFQAKLYLD